MNDTRPLLVRSLRPLLLAGFGLLVSVPAMAGGQAPPPKDLVSPGDAVCTKCHDETSTYPVLAIGKTPHGVAADKRNPTCVDCHGESKDHITKLEGQTQRAKPDVAYGGQYLATPAEDLVERYFGRFGRFTPTPTAERNEACLKCHEGSTRMHWYGSTHEAQGVACTNCHQVHAAHDRVRDRQAQTELCYTCHKQQRAQMNRVYHHPVPEGDMSCSDCHNTHGSAAPNQMRRDSVNETCYQCHMEKRGPFVWNHQPVTEDCTICHNPHGSNVEKMLTVRQPFLCQECHEPVFHRAQIAQLPRNAVGGSNVGTVGRGCTGCHTNVHGSNSANPEAATEAGPFFRR
jgi:DmsE family decaheme c-type cytochrome